MNNTEKLQVKLKIARKSLFLSYKEIILTIISWISTPLMPRSDRDVYGNHDVPLTVTLCENLGHFFWLELHQVPASLVQRGWLLQPCPFVLCPATFDDRFFIVKLVVDVIFYIITKFYSNFSVQESQARLKFRVLNSYRSVHGKFWLRHTRSGH